MNAKERERFALKLLNTEVREALRRQVTQIKKLESLDDLKGLKLVKLTVEYDGSCNVGYRATATPNFYPHVREHLIREGVTNERNSLLIGTGYANNLSISEEVQFTISGRHMCVTLQAYNPKFEK